MNIHEMIADIERDISRDKAKIERTLDLAKAERRSHLTVAEDQASEMLLDGIEANRAKLARAQAIAAEERISEERLTETHVVAARTSGRAYDQVARIGSEPLTYRKEVKRNSDGSPAEPTFITDLFRAQVLGDFSSSERLARHGQEMQIERPKLVERAVGSGGVPGFVPPQYMSELFALYARAGRPTANLCRKMPLPPEGMTVNIPRVTSPTTTAIQASEGGAIGNSDPASTLLTANVNTVAGYVTVSRQALERGPMTEEVIVSDLSADYNAKLDAQILNGSGVSGQHLGILGVSSINAVTYTAATPILVGATSPMWPKLASGVGQVMSGRYAGPNAMVMSPTEWAWMLSTVDASTYRPVIQPVEVGGSDAFNQIGTMPGAPGYSGIAGYLFNLPVYLDGSMPANLGAGTNETRIIIADFEDLILFEDSSGAPTQLHFEQTSGQTLQILLIAYGYSAFAGGRQPKAISVLAGTGMITPSL
jgi:HK97 family phage major capsid protein